MRAYTSAKVLPFLAFHHTVKREKTMSISWWGVLIVGLSVTLTLGVVEQKQRKAISNLQKGIDEIKQQLSELQRKVDGLR